MTKSPWSIVAIIVAVIVIICCLCVFAAVVGGFAFFRTNSSTIIAPPPQEATIVIRPSRTPSVERATPTPRQATTPEPLDETPAPTPTLSANIPPLNAGDETLNTLEEAVVPVNDLFDLAARLQGKTDIDPTVPIGPAPQLGDTQKFWLTDTQTNTNYQVDAVLRAISEHVYFWVENNLNYSKPALDSLLAEFDNNIYPTNREFFGSEWSPGIDNDPRLYILYTRRLGGNTAGYFSMVDEMSPAIREDSNAHEMFVISAEFLGLDEEFTRGVLAHEFQHMIHWFRDRNEDIWMNEGFSELAAFINGYSPGGHDFAYAEDPDLQLNDWPTTEDNVNATIPHYGASFLFLNYFLNRFGEDATKALVADEDNGFDSIDRVLSDLNATDPETGQVITADDVFRDWVLASFIQDTGVGDGRYDYTNYRGAPQPDTTEQIRNCNDNPQAREVSQYGVDYIRISCRGDYRLNFSGSTETGLLPTDPSSGSYAFWSNKGDQSDMTLTREFDFTNVSAPVEMTYQMWYDLETDWDYAYVVVSEDGERWDIVDTPSCTTENPAGNSYGCGYSGKTGDWIEETVDLSAYAGKKVQVRFEYVTDAAVNGEGLMIDDIRVPAVDYSSDFETDEGGWTAAGFVRVQNALPQKFLVSVIERGGSTTVRTVTLDENQTGSVDFSLGFGQDVVLVVSGSTRFTRQPAAYSFSFDQR